ncbi:MAG: acyl-CoA dehydrogenase family protein [Polyangiaceae bacterium]
MDFGWSAAQEEHFARMRTLGAEVQAAAPDDRLGRLAAAGVLGLALSSDHGGSGLDLLTTAGAFEALGTTCADGGVLLAAGAHLFGAALTVQRVGTAEQRAAWLPRLARGEVLATVAATEEASGSDIAAALATATPRAGGGFSVDGRKRYVTSADRAGLFLVFARQPAPAAGLVALLVPAGPRVVAGPLWATAGLRGARLAPVELRDVEVGPEAVLGRAGAGMAVFQIAMAFERALVLAFRLGAMQRQLDAAVTFARQREAGGVPIARHQAVAHRVARMKLRLETARLVLYRAAWVLDRGQRGQAEAALAKWHVASEALESALDAVHLRGGAGYLSEGEEPGAIDDALGGTIHSGTADVLATIVARWLGV